MSIRVIIADDHKLFREGLVNLLSDSADIEIVAEAENGNDVFHKAKELKPDIVIMDIGMPVLNGVDATKILIRELPDIKVIALSMHSDKQYIKGMLEAGASGYLFKNCTYNQLIDAINSVNNGKIYLGDEITEVVVHDYLGKEGRIINTDHELSERELEILKLIADGKSTREVGEILFISIKTVGTHKQNILEKLKLKNTAGLVKYALKKGIISL